MQYRGIIENWDDERGFGFVLPDGVGPSTFVHITKFAYRPRRPVEGDAIVFNLALDAEDRPQAVNIRFEGESPPPNRNRPVSSDVNIGLGESVGLAFVCLLVALVVLKIIPVGVLLFYTTMSVVTTIAYAQDKVAAQENLWRTSEFKLQVLALLGGWPGALLGQKLFRHKTQKTSFQVAFWIGVVLNCGLFAVFLTTFASDTFAALVRSFKEKSSASTAEEPQPPQSEPRTEPSTDLRTHAERDNSTLPVIRPLRK